MQAPPKEPEQDRPRYSFGATLAMVTGMVVVVVGLSVIVALIGGMWLDKILGTKPILTVALIVMAGPVSLYAVYRITTSVLSRMNPALPARPGRVTRTYYERGEDE
jgi:hypothetical protein